MLRGTLLRPLRVGLRARSTVAVQDDPVAAHAARPFREIPGPKETFLLGNTWRFIKGIGTYGHLNIMEQQIRLREEFGDIIRISGVFGRNDQLFVYNPQYVETVLRNDGRWPFRETPASMHYYRTVLRKDHFNGLAGTMTTQGEDWQKFRSKVNQPLMQPRAALRFIEPINAVADELLDKMRASLDENNELPEDFLKELYKWSVESIASIALDTRMGCLARNLAADSEPQRLIDATHTIFESFVLLDLQPSLWRYISTPAWRRFVDAMDVFTDVADKYIKIATERMKHRSTNREQSILERLLATEGPAVANLMASDMLFGGVDTTSHLTASLLFFLAKNPGAQEKLAEELRRSLPNSHELITPHALDEMPYLKACIKESLRIFPIAIGNSRRTQTELVLGGYKVPKGVDVLMCHMVMSRDETHYPRPLSFEPERWLRGGPQAHSAHPFVTMPFGFGPRTCVGRRFAELEVQILVAKVVRKFRLEYHHGDELLYTTNVMNNIKNPLKFRLLPRDD